MSSPSQPTAESPSQPTAESPSQPTAEGAEDEKKLPALPPKRTSSLRNDVKKDKKPSPDLMRQLEESTTIPEDGIGDGIGTGGIGNGIGNADDDDDYADLKRRITLGKDWKMGALSQQHQHPHPHPHSSFDPAVHLSNLRMLQPALQTDSFNLTSDHPLEHAGQRAMHHVQRMEGITRSAPHSPILGPPSGMHSPISLPSDSILPTTTTPTITPTTLIPPEKREHMRQARQYILNELLETERNYMLNLDAVLTHFKAPLLRALGAGAPALGIGSHAMSSSASLLGTHASISPDHSNAALFPTADPSPGNLATNKYASVSSASGVTLAANLERSNSTTGNPTFKPIVPMVDIKIIFGFIDDLHEASRAFHEDLVEVVRMWPQSEQIWSNSIPIVPSSPPLTTTTTTTTPSSPQPRSIGNLFLSHSRDWQIYLKFVDNYSAAKEAIRRNETSSVYRQFLQDNLKNNRAFQKGDLANFLILPVQRVTRYVLLLQDLKKNTPADHPDHPSIVSALSDMRSLANTVNEVKRNEEEMTRMFHVVRSVLDMPPTIISAQRRLVFETDVYDVTKDHMLLALKGAVTIGNTGLTMMPSLAAMLPPNASSSATIPGPGGSMSMGSSSSSANDKDRESPMIRIFLFNDIVVLAKLKGKKKWTSKFGSVTASSLMGSGKDGSGDKEQSWQLFRISWIKDVDILDLGNLDGSTGAAHGTGASGDAPSSSPAATEIPPPKSRFNFLGPSTQKQKHFLKVVIKNSDAGNVLHRKKFLQELQELNQQLLAASRRASASAATATATVSGTGVAGSTAAALKRNKTMHRGIHISNTIGEESNLAAEQPPQQPSPSQTAKNDVDAGKEQSTTMTTSSTPTSIAKSEVASSSSSSSGASTEKKEGRPTSSQSAPISPLTSVLSPTSTSLSFTLPEPTVDEESFASFLPSIGSIERLAQINLAVKEAEERETKLGAGVDGPGSDTMSLGSMAQTVLTSLSAPSTPHLGSLSRVASPNTSSSTPSAAIQEKKSIPHPKRTTSLVTPVPGIANMLEQIQFDKQDEAGLVIKTKTDKDLPAIPPVSPALLSPVMSPALASSSPGTGAETPRPKPPVKKQLVKQELEDEDEDSDEDVVPAQQNKRESLSLIEFLTSPPPPGFSSGPPSATSSIGTGGGGRAKSVTSPPLPQLPTSPPLPALPAPTPASGPITAAGKVVAATKFLTRSLSLNHARSKVISSSVTSAESGVMGGGSQTSLASSQASVHSNTGVVAGSPSSTGGVGGGGSLSSSLTHAASMTSASHQVPPPPPQQSVTETFIVEVGDPKQKNEFLLVWERLFKTLMQQLKLQQQQQSSTSTTASSVTSEDR